MRRVSNWPVCGLTVQNATLATAQFNVCCRSGISPVRSGIVINASINSTYQLDFLILKLFF